MDFTSMLFIHPLPQKTVETERLSHGLGPGSGCRFGGRKKNTGRGMQDRKESVGSGLARLAIL